MCYTLDSEKEVFRFLGGFEMNVEMLKENLACIYYQSHYINLTFGQQKKIDKLAKEHQSNPAKLVDYRECL